MLSWDVHVKKAFIYPHVVEEVRRRVDLLNASGHLPAMVPISSVELRPLQLILHANNDAALRLLGPLEDYEELKPMAEVEARNVLKSVMMALTHLHASQLVHGHLRAELIRRRRGTESEIVILHHHLPPTLFVSASPMGRGILALAAPEICRREAYAFAADVWSLGVLLLELTMQDGRSFITEDVVGTDLLSPWISSLSGAAKSFVMVCLKEDAEDRPTVGELLVHPFFEEGVEEREGWDAALNDGASSSSGEEEVVEHSSSSSSSSEEEEDEEDSSTDEEDASRTFLTARG